jgi:membrane protease YdiL (CAAX protease family)
MTDLPPPQTTTFDHALYGSGKPWRGIVAILSFLVGFFLLSLNFGVLAVTFDIITGVTDVDTLMTGEIGATPAVMLMNNLSLAALVPLAILLQALFFGVRLPSLFSVADAFRWRWLGRLALVIAPVWIIYIALSFVLEPAGEVRIDGTAIALLVIVLLTTPLQSAGEEFGTRGLIQRSVGSWFRNSRVAFLVSTVVASTLFALAHFAADPWLIAFYFVFAASASIMARGTGGLEAPVLLHAINNVLVFIPTILLGQLEASFDRSEGTGDPSALIGIALCIGIAVFSIWWARRHGVVTRVAIPLRMPRIPAPPIVLPMAAEPPTGTH